MDEVVTQHVKHLAVMVGEAGKPLGKGQEEVVRTGV